MLTLPDYVLNGQTITAADVANLHDRAFADPANRRFPLHTKEATVMSAIAYFGQGGKDAHVQARIRAQAVQHGVLDVEQKIEGIFQNQQEKSASAPEAHFALTIEDGENVTMLYPIDSESNITESARFIIKDATERRLPLSFVRAAALTLVKRAHDLQLPVEQIIPAEIISLGENRIPNFDEAKQAAVRRRVYCDLDEQAFRLLNEAVDAAKEAYYEGEDIEDFIDVWRMVDDGAGVKYSALIKNPYQVFFSGEKRSDVEKFASEIVFVGETPLPSEVVLGLRDADIDGYFRAQTAALVKQARDAAAAETARSTHLLAGLSEPDQRALLSLVLATTTG